jgi:RNA polymerase sigma-70 factor, ECF subfamily
MRTAVSVGAMDRASQAVAPRTGVTAPDAGSRVWITDLEDSGQRHDEAVARLHELLLSAARFEVNRRRATLPHLRGDDFDDLAVQSADDALVAVLSRLDTYKGDSNSPPGHTSSRCLRQPSSCARGRGRGGRSQIEPEMWPLLASETALPRGALYKTLHDARQKLRASLAIRGMTIGGKERRTHDTA